MRSNEFERTWAFRHLYCFVSSQKSKLWKLSGHSWPSLTFTLFVLVMLALDLGVFHRSAHAISTREALTWIAVWIALAFVFCGILYLFWDKIPHEADYTNSQAALAFLTGYIIEKALSIDNVVVILMLFSYFSIPAKYQHRVCSGASSAFW